MLPIVVLCSWRTDKDRFSGTNEAEELVIVDTAGLVVIWEAVTELLSKPCSISGLCGIDDCSGKDVDDTALDGVSLDTPPSLPLETCVKGKNGFLI